MRRGLTVLGAVLALLALVVVTRAVGVRSRQVRGQRRASVAVDAAAAGRLAEALGFRTVSHQDPARFEAAEFLGLRRHLETAFPRVHRTLEREVVGGYSLLYTWHGREPALPPLLLLAHLDVVPVEPGTEADWTHPPFAGAVADGYLWGRGAMDDKVGVLGLLEATEALLAAGFAPRRTVYLAFGHDEEVGGHEGAAAVAALLAGREVTPELILDEGLVIAEGTVPGVPAPVAMVGVAEKGAITVELVAAGQGGHSSMPPAETAAGIVAAAVTRLERHQMPAAITPPVRQLFRALAPEARFPLRVVLANLWLFAPVLERVLIETPPAAAMVRTTTAPTMLEAGPKENVLPARARAVVNFRIRPGDSVAGVLEHVRATVADARVTVTALPALRAEPSAESPIDGPAYAVLAATIRGAFPEVVVAPALVLGMTDSRHYARLTPNVYRFLPWRAGPDDAQRVHGTNERIRLADYAGAVRFYALLIRNAAG